MANDTGVQPGWYADPLQRFEQRWYNGTTWTADVSNDGERFVDPLGIEVAPAGARTISPGAVGSTGDPVSAASNGAATTAMVLGIVAISISWLPFIVLFGLVAAVLALVFGWMGLRRSKPSGSGRSRAIVGLVTGASALVAAAIGVALSIVVLDALDRYESPAPNEVSITSCSVAGARASAIGELENLGPDVADFSVLVGFVRPGTDNPDRTVRILVDDVGPGERVEFDAERQVELADVDCIIISVKGPLPFGVEID